MAYKDLLLALTSYPERTAGGVIDQAAAFAEAVEARLSALTFEVEIPNVSNVLARAALDIDGMIASERQKSSDNARDLLDEFEAAATKRGVFEEALVQACPTSHVVDVLVDHARLRDLTMVPVGADAGAQRFLAEALIFGSGRPVLVLPEAAPRDFALQRVAIAWDFSRPAARAVADALPLLGRAGAVRAVTVVNEKAIPTRRSGTELARHLARHGVELVLDEEDGGGRPIGEVLDAYCEAHRIDLLVMGAYGHSRMRDFLLGGATKGVLAKPSRPILLSH